MDETKTTQNNETAITQPKEQPSPSAEAQALIELKAQVEKLTKENAGLQEAKKKYYDTVLNGQTPAENNDSQKRTKKEVIDDMVKCANEGGSNLQYAMLACELDDIVLEETGQSVFIPANNVEGASAKEIESGRRTRELFDYAIEQADGNPTVFNMILQQHISKPTPVKGNIKKR